MKHRRDPWGFVALLAAFLIFPTVGYSGGDSSAPALPPFKIADSPYYPAQAKRLGLTGRVGLQFTIDAKGRAQNVVIVDSAGQVLDDHAKALLTKGHFEVPSDWESTGGPSRRYTWGFIYELTNKPKVSAFPDNRPTMTITGSGI